MAKKTIETTDALDPEKEEDLVDLDKVSDLAILGNVARVNTLSILSLQRLRTERTVGGLSSSDIDAAITSRQMRSGKLIRRRQALQAKELEKKRRILEEAIKPTTGKIQSTRAQILDLLKGLDDTVKLARKMSNDEGQRMMAARLKLWEDSILNCLMILDRLPALPKEVDELELSR